jgi:threonine dehydrogenase-like Zn-dependent dehydrogenase
MRAVQFDLADPSFPASLVEVDEPALPGPAWARVAVTTGGICGSDLHLFTGNVGPSPTLVGVATFPFLLGHEIAGVVTDAGPDCPVPVGTRVAVDPCIPCAPRGIDPPCANCAAGMSSSCLNLDSHVLTGGRSLGFTAGLGGGWAEMVAAHASMLHPLPDAIPDRAASLHEPVSIACHGLLRASPRDGDPVLIVGAGIIGLAALAALRGVFPGHEVTVLARHQQQADAARACGADHVVMQVENGAHMEELALLCGGRVVGRKTDTMLMSGFPYVIEAVGSGQSITEALRCVAHRGTVLMLGAGGVSTVDMTPVWYKEAALVGSIDHCTDAGRHSIDRALDVLAAGLLPHDVVVTHEFPIDAYRDAIGAAIDRRGSGAIKVVFRNSVA